MAQGRKKDEELWEKVVKLLRLNPQVSYKRISREVGCTSQTVGNIARANGFPHRGGGEFRGTPDEPLVMETAQWKA